MRYWYGQDGGFSILTVSDSAPRCIRPVVDTVNGSGAVRRYPVPWRCSATGTRVGEPLDEETAIPAETNCATRVSERNGAAIDGWPRAGRRITYHPELTRREAAKLRERERYARERAARERAAREQA